MQSALPNGRVVYIVQFYNASSVQSLEFLIHYFSHVIHSKVMRLSIAYLGLAFETDFHKTLE